MLDGRHPSLNEEAMLRTSDSTQAVSNENPVDNQLTLSLFKLLSKAKYGNGNTALHVAVEEGNMPLVEYLVTTGADLEAKNKDGDTALTLASYEGHESIVKFLIEKKANLEAKGKNGNTPLSLSSLKGHESIVKFLIENNANLEAKAGGEGKGRTPLARASFYGFESIVKLLIKAKANLEARDNNDDTPLSLATFKGYESIVKQLIDAGADLEAKDIDGDTLLTLASYNGHESIVKFFIEKKANLEAKDKNGNTALLWAVLKGHETVVKQLVEAGADLEAKNKDGDTALTLAKRKGHNTIVQLLQEAKQKVAAAQPSSFSFRRFIPSMFSSKPKASTSTSTASSSQTSVPQTRDVVAKKSDLIGLNSEPVAPQQTNSLYPNLTQALSKGSVATSISPASNPDKKTVSSQSSDDLISWSDDELPTYEEAMNRIALGRDKITQGENLFAFFATQPSITSQPVVDQSNDSKANQNSISDDYEARLIGQIIQLPSAPVESPVIAPRKALFN